MLPFPSQAMFTERSHELQLQDNLSRTDSEYFSVQRARLISPSPPIKEDQRLGDHSFQRTTDCQRGESLRKIVTNSTSSNFTYSNSCLHSSNTYQNQRVSSAIAHSEQPITKNKYPLDSKAPESPRTVISESVTNPVITCPDTKKLNLLAMALTAIEEYDKQTTFSRC